MSTAASKMNLRPQERRLIVFVAIVVFIVLNIWFIWPLFDDWKMIKSRQERAKTTYQSYQAEIAKTPVYRAKLRDLQSAGPTIVPDEQELDLVRTVDNQARLNRLLVLQSDPRAKQSMSTQTNRFFEEQYVTLHTTSDNEELVNFLTSLTSTNSLIRVKDLALKTADVGATKLDAHMTLVASYQRKTPARGQAQTAPRSTNLAAAAQSAAVASKTTPSTRRTVSTNRSAVTTPSPASTNRIPSRVIPSKIRGTNQPVRNP